MNPEQSERVNRWIERLGDELTIEATMDLPTSKRSWCSKAAAHNVERPAAPVTTYLMGYAVARGADARSVGQIVKRLAQGVRMTQESDDPRCPVAGACSRARPWAVLSSEVVPLVDALGRILASDAAALTDSPGFPTAAMDGWVVCGPGPWTIVGRSTPARAVWCIRCREAMRIGTGGAVPAGATAVIPFEAATVTD